MTISVNLGSMLDWLDAYDGPLFDSCVTDPPYHLTSIVKRFGGANAAECQVGATGAYARAAKGFMGKEWDGGDIAFRPETWRKVYDALKPGAHLIAFSGTRTYHRMACAIEDAGFEIRDSIYWHYGSGFPKSHNVSKGIDRANGDERPVIGLSKHKPGIANGTKGHNTVGGTFAAHVELTSAASAKWEGWGSALKPSTEPICLAHKPLSEKSIAANVLKHGTGALNIDGCRVGTDGESVRKNTAGGLGYGGRLAVETGTGTHESTQGRWPANLAHDGSDEVLAGFPETSSGEIKPQTGPKKPSAALGEYAVGNVNYFGPSEGSAARFFYSAKAGPLDRLGTAHATVKPVDLMRWLVRMVTPPGGHVLEPFAGSGKTGIACMAEGFDCTMIDIEAEHVADIKRQLAFLQGQGAHSFAEHNHAKNLRTKHEPLGGLFGEAA